MSYPRESVPPESDPEVSVTLDVQRGNGDASQTVALGNPARPRFAYDRESSFRSDEKPALGVEFQSQDRRGARRPQMSPVPA
jgi:hypothetical protein